MSLGGSHEAPRLMRAVWRGGAVQEKEPSYEMLPKVYLSMPVEVDVSQFRPGRVFWDNYKYLIADFEILDISHRIDIFSQGWTP